MGFTTRHPGGKGGVKLLRFLTDEASFDTGVGRVRPPAVTEAPGRPPSSPQVAVIPLQEAQRRTQSSRRVPSVPQDAASRRLRRTRVSACTDLPVPATHGHRPRLRRATSPSTPFREVPRITHYLPQANVARDGQSERQCNVLHRLSHGSVQNPANTEVPPTAAPSSDWGRARPATAAWQGHSPPGEETKTRF